ncbi:expressed conserved protein [Echinococcus multilocularis]|uniref:Expressed conserved protein n=1 Tax=Echinococcus multilocularis TaxID=6211 RepID=A0A087VXI1_ECHMU|nr:expressed conserved protein [Echinococcus multilocularis]
MNTLLLLLTIVHTILPSLACYGNGCGGQYNFRACNEPTCHYGKYNGYGCRHGVCPFVCYGSGCRNTQTITSTVGLGQWGLWLSRLSWWKLRVWGGCVNGHCGGFYDFRNCKTPSCVSGPYHGYACFDGTCRYICFQGICHTPYAYGLGCYGPGCDGYYQFPKVGYHGTCSGSNSYYGEECEETDENKKTEKDKIK